MRLTAPGRRAVRLVGALAAFLAAVVVWTPSAGAGCGPHRLTSRSEADHELMRLRLLDPGSDGPAETQQVPPRAPAPCSGAFCSGNPAAPASAAPSLVGDGGEDWALSAVLVAPAGPGCLIILATVAPPRPVDRAEAIFHPPPHLAHLDA